MLRFIYGKDLDALGGALVDGMFRDRANQFAARRKWDVSVDADGYERDRYDAFNPLYVIWQTEDGGHGGSMRLLPTLKPTMINEVFGKLLPDGALRCAKIWECTRFCLGPGADSRTAAALMLAGGVVLQAFGLRYYAGVFDPPMVRIYRAIGAPPRILGTSGQGRNRISAGLWAFTPEAQARVATRAGLSARQVGGWLTADLRRAAERALA